MKLRRLLCLSVVGLGATWMGFAATPPPDEDRHEGPAAYPIHSRSLAFSPDGKTAACGCTDRTIHLWDISTGKNTVLRGHERGVSCVVYSPDGKTLASASWDKTIKVWDVGTGMEKTTLKGHSLAVSSLAFSPDGDSWFRQVLTRRSSSGT